MLTLLAGMGAGELLVSLSPAFLKTQAAGATFTTPTMTGLVSGGSGSFAYAWSPVVFDGVMTPGSPVAASTTFDWSSIAVGDRGTGTVTLTVTDTVSGRVAAASAPVSHFRKS